MIEVVILAAGASSRFGSDKLISLVRGKALLAHTLDSALSYTDRSRLLVVVGNDQSQRALIATSAGARIVSCKHAARGLRWSIYAGLRAADEAATGIVILLADDPLAALDLGVILNRAAEIPNTTIAIKRESKTPHPVYIPRMHWPAPPVEDDDDGLRALLDSRTEWIDLPFSRSKDVDTLQDAEELDRELGR